MISKETRPSKVIMSTMNIQRTYAGRRQALSRKRPLSTDATDPNPPKRPRILTDTNRSLARPQEAKRNGKQKQQKLIQLHFCVDRPILRTCPSCSLSYTKGVPEDEALHSAHCVRVQKGMEWGREEEKEKFKACIEEVVTGAKLKSGLRGRIICFRADVSGRIGSKVSQLAWCLV